MKIIGAIYTVILMLLFSISAKATTMVHNSFSELVDQSDFVVSGKVTGIDVATVSEDDIRIFTTITISNASIIDEGGETPQSEDVLIRYFGGVVDVPGDVPGDGFSRKAEIVGMPTFSLGEDVVLFIRDNGEDDVPFVAMGQGVLRISEDDSVRDSSGEFIAEISDGEIKVNSSIGPVTKSKMMSLKHQSEGKQKPRAIHHSGVKHEIILANEFSEIPESNHEFKKLKRSELYASVMKYSKEKVKRKGKREVNSLRSEKRDRLYSPGFPKKRYEQMGPVKAAKIESSKGGEVESAEYIEGRGHKPSRNLITQHEIK
ncbi:hypothetical protein [Teredinibacter turnerae]|uniref:hypothetical protein n=2 Tax=Teredinibacter turnerae TaxID=2426 RepID=UPI0030CFEE2F